MPAHVAADERPRLPQRLGDGQAEALAGGLLDHHVGLRLERVDLDRAHVVQVVEDVDVGVAVGVGHRLVEELPALGVVGGHRTDQRQLHLGDVLLDQPVGVDHAHRVLPRVEARHLAQQRAVHVDSELVAHVRGVLGREGHVLGRQRVDRGRADVHRRAVHAAGHVVLEVEDRAVVGADERDEPLDGRGVRRGEVDVAAPDPAPRLLRHVLVDRRRLRVVHDDRVPAARQLLGVAARCTWRRSATPPATAPAGCPAARCGAAS